MCGSFGKENLDELLFCALISCVCMDSGEILQKQQSTSLIKKQSLPQLTLLVQHLVYLTCWHRQWSDQTLWWRGLHPAFYYSTKHFEHCWFQSKVSLKSFSVKKAKKSCPLIVQTWKKRMMMKSGYLRLMNCLKCYWLLQQWVQQLQQLLLHHYCCV